MLLTLAVTQALLGATGACKGADEAAKAAEQAKPGPTTQPAAAPASATAAAEFQRHEVAPGEFRFKAPVTWKKADKPGAAAVLTLWIDEQRSSLKVNAMDVTPGNGLKQTVAASEAQIPKANKNFKHAKTEFFQAGGAPAARVVFDVTARGQNLKVMQVLLSRGQKLYGLTFTAASDRFAALAPTFDQVIASAEFQ